MTDGITLTIDQTKVLAHLLQDYRVCLHETRDNDDLGDIPEFVQASTLLYHIEGTLYCIANEEASAAS